MLRTQSRPIHAIHAHPWVDRDRHHPFHGMNVTPLSLFYLVVGDTDPFLDTISGPTSVLAFVCLLTMQGQMRHSSRPWHGKHRTEG